MHFYIRISNQHCCSGVQKVQAVALSPISPGLCGNLPSRQYSSWNNTPIFFICFILYYYIIENREPISPGVGPYDPGPENALNLKFGRVFEGGLKNITLRPKTFYLDSWRSPHLTGEGVGIMSL